MMVIGDGDDCDDGDDGDGGDDGDDVADGDGVDHGDDDDDGDGDDGDDGDDCKIVCMHDRTMLVQGGKPPRGVDLPESSSPAEEVGEEEGGHVHVKALVEVSAGL